MKTTAPTPFLESIQLVNFLSYGPDAEPLRLEPLNVLIGPNGSGKSNLVEALALLAAVPGELPKPIREGGGVREWLWKGEERADRATLEVVLEHGAMRVDGAPSVPIRYRLAFAEVGEAFQVADERLENAVPEPGTDAPTFYFGRIRGRPMLAFGKSYHELKSSDLDPTLSILAQRKDPDAYPELTQVGRLFGAIRLYRRWSFGPDGPLRSSCRADVRTDHLDERLANLPARLAVLKRDQKVKKQLLEALKECSDSFTDLEVVPEGGLLRLFLVEPNREVPASRLSDGTLRYLCLLAILLDPKPPPLIVLEEPELGLHPDLMPTLARLLRAASERCQIVTTTHSDALVSALSQTPESVVVCERHEGRSTLRRLVKDEVEPYLASYRLGELWMRGDLGGTRW